jgi:hypothetical protein
MRYKHRFYPQLKVVAKKILIPQSSKYFCISSCTMTLYFFSIFSCVKLEALEVSFHFDVGCDILGVLFFSLIIQGKRQIFSFLRGFTYSMRREICENYVFRHLRIFDLCGQRSRKSRQLYLTVTAGLIYIVSHTHIKHYSYKKNI